MSQGLQFDTGPRPAFCMSHLRDSMQRFRKCCRSSFRGSTCVVAPSSTFAGTQLGNLIRRERVDTIFITPGCAGDTLARCTVVGHHDRHRRGGSVGSSAGTWADGRRFVNAYSPSESTVAATMGLQKAAVVPHIGSGTGHVDADPRFGPAQVDGPNIGELCVARAGLARGDLDRPALTATRFAANPY